MGRDAIEAFFAAQLILAFVTFFAFSFSGRTPASVAAYWHRRITGVAASDSRRRASAWLVAPLVGLALVGFIWIVWSVQTATACLLAGICTAYFGYCLGAPAREFLVQMAPLHRLRPQIDELSEREADFRDLLALADKVLDGCRALTAEGAWETTSTTRDARKSVDSLQDNVRQLSAKLFYRDEAVENLKQANTALVDQLKTRFTFVQMVVSMVTFLFVINFGYQVWKTEEVRDVGKRVSSAVDALSGQRSAMTRQSTVLMEFAQAVASLTSAQRAINQKKYTQAVNRAEAVCKRLAARLDDIHQALDEMQSKLDEKSLDDEQKVALAASINQLQPQHAILKNLLFSAYDMAAFAHSLRADVCKDDDLHRKEVDRVHQLAKLMLRQDEDRWEGYHYEGLYYSDRLLASSPHAPSPDEATKFYRQSVALDEESKIDIVNLAEWAFLHEDFEEARKQAQAYLAYDPAPASDVQWACRLFVTVSGYLVDADRAKADHEMKAFMKESEVEANKHPGKGYGEAYSFDDLRDYWRLLGPRGTALAAHGHGSYGERHGVTPPECDARRQQLYASLGTFLERASPGITSR